MRLFLFTVRTVVGECEPGKSWVPPSEDPNDPDPVVKVGSPLDCLLACLNGGGGGCSFRNTGGLRSDATDDQPCQLIPCASCVVIDSSVLQTEWLDVDTILAGGFPALVEGRVCMITDVAAQHSSAWHGRAVCT